MEYSLRISDQNDSSQVEAQALQKYSDRDKARESSSDRQDSLCNQIEEEKMQADYERFNKRKKEMHPVSQEQFDTTQSENEEKKQSPEENSNKSDRRDRDSRIA